MPLSWNEINSRALAFSSKYADVKSERAEAQSFLNDFFNVFGIERKQVAVFERHAERIDGSKGRIDLFWPGMILVEMKSRGEDLEDAFQQALGYLHNISGLEHPRYILVSDFKSFKLFDLEPEVRDMFKDNEFELKDLHKNIKLFSRIAGYKPQQVIEQNPADIDAAELMGKLHDELKKKIGYTGHDLEVLLVRLLFCLFADSTGIFLPNGIFRDYIAQRTSPDGSDLAMHLDKLFDILNQDESNRLPGEEEHMLQFPYVNGKLFEEQIRKAVFTSEMRKHLLECCAFDWSEISPAIFGALFQSIMDDKARRNIGAHYTSEKNILKLIQPLFLDSLWREFHRIKRNPILLKEFHAKLRSLKFFDPACGCGNFLVISYRELRKLEHKILKELDGMGQLDQDFRDLIRVNVDQFYGIELEEWPAQIAQVAMWLVDHQMNVSASRKFGKPIVRIPLKTSPTIVNGDALTIEWSDVVRKEELSYILGNPPFVGSKFLSTDQKADLQSVFTGIKNSGTLDYVTGWYVKAARFIQHTEIVCAFVSTNSISQGEQPGILWAELFRLGIKIHFAHRTFVWRNEASGMAAVHCVIIGFAAFNTLGKKIYDYTDIKGEPHAVEAKNINPYLVDAPDITLPSRQNPLCDVPRIGIGNQPIDNGQYLFTPEEMKEFISQEPESKKWFRRWIGSDELLNGYNRYCLWLGECEPDELQKMPFVIKRIEAVKSFRKASKRSSTIKLANTPTRFQVENIPKSKYLAIPEVSSERRPFIPIGFEKPSTLASNLLKIMPKATLYHFGILSSTMHMAWVRATCGRLESRYRYSKDIVYNNYPWPVNATAKQKAAIDEAAEGVLDARKQFPNSSLSNLYDPITMPPALVKAHQALDKAVDAAYGKRKFATEAERVAYLFELYQNLTTPLLPVEKKSRKKSVSSLRDF
jgi:N-6 DNA Methylase